MSVSQRSRRVSFFRKWSLRLGLLAASAAVTGIALIPKASRGNDYTVVNTNDSGAGSLRDAIEQANLAGAGNHTISFDSGLAPNSLVQLADELEHIQVNIIIDGGGHTLSGHNNHQLFFVAFGNVTIKNFTLTQGNSVGGNGGSADQAGAGGGGLGAGGAIFVDSGTNVTVQNVVFTQNKAEGGAGGSINAFGSGQGGGGGGGLHGDGANGGYNGGGGGGGFLGNGGEGSQSGINPSGGGGGGGLLGDGGSGSNSVEGTGGGAGGSLLLSGGNGVFDLGGLSGVTGGDGGNGASGGGTGQSGSAGSTTGGGGGGGGHLSSSGQGGNGGNGGDFGGGGGGGQRADGGTGGDFGGGGGGGQLADAGTGGFGGGGGGSGFAGDEGTAGFGGGEGGATYTGGGGGSGYGGAIFVRGGGSLTVIDSQFNNNVVTVGDGGAGAPNNNTDGTDGDAKGSGVYVMSGTTLNFSVTSGGNIDVADTIGGDGEVRKIGIGTLVLSGNNTYIGDTHVDNGRLVVNGHVEGTVRVAGSGTLAGNGTINSEVFNDGIIAPGNSIGTLNINGNVHLNPSSYLEIEINAAGQNDLITANGDANLGGSVFVQAAPGNYTHGQHYTFLTYTGNRTGSFAHIYDDLAFFDAVLQYGAQDVSFYLQGNSNNFIDIAQTFNEKSVATVLDDFTGSAIQPIADQMQYMSNSQVQHALNELSGEVYATNVQAQFQNTTNQMQMLAQHLRPNSGTGFNGGVAAAQQLPADENLIAFDRSGELVIRGQSDCVPSYTSWGTGYGLGGNAQTDGNAAGLNYALGGVQLGFDRWLDEGTLAGLYGGYNYAQLDGNGLSQRVQANSGQFGGYYRRDDGCDYYLLASGLGFDAYNASRTIAIGGFNATTSANYDGWQSATYLERGRTYNVGLTQLQPYAALQYIYLRQNSFSETGGGVAGLDVAGVDANSLRGILGGRASREVTTARGLVLVPQVRAAWLHEFLETDTLINNRFGSVAGSSFVIEGLDFGRDWALLGGGLGWRMTEQLTLTGNYDAQVNERQAFHVGSANVQYVW